MILELSEKINKFFNTPKGISRQARPVGTPWLGDCEACISVSLLSEVTRQTVCGCEEGISTSKLLDVTLCYSTILYTFISSIHHPFFNMLQNITTVLWFWTRCLLYHLAIYWCHWTCCSAIISAMWMIFMDMRAIICQLPACLADMPACLALP